MVAATPYPIALSAEDYLDWEPQQEVRYEFVDGAVYGMMGGTVPHNDIAINLVTILLPAVRAQGCRLNVADVKLHLAASNRYYYPDLMVSLLDG